MRLLIVVSMVALTGCVTRPLDPPSTDQKPPPTTRTNHSGPSVYGIPLGSPLALAECGKYTISRVTTYKIAKGAPCFQSHPAQGRPIPAAAAGDSVLVAFPPDALPREASSGTISAIMVAGNVEGFVVSTQGYQTQDMIYAGLAERYGPPTTRDRLQLTGGGTTLTGGIVATWVLPDVRVFFVGVLGGADRGTLRIATPVGEQAHKARLSSL